MRPLLLAFGAALTVTAPASAHPTGPHTGFVSTVSRVDPNLPGLIVRVEGGHERLVVRNWTQKRIVVFNEAGRAAVELAPGETRTWADPRIGADGPPPESGEFVRNWRIPAEADGEPFAILGFLGYRPPAEAAKEDALPVWGIALAGGLGAAVLAAALALPRRRKGEGERVDGTMEP